MEAELWQRGSGSGLRQRYERRLDRLCAELRVSLDQLARHVQCTRPWKRWDESSLIVALTAPANGSHLMGNAVSAIVD